MKRTTEFILLLIVALWQTLISIAVIFSPLLFKHFFNVSVHPTLYLIAIHLIVAIFFWIAAFAVHNNRPYWGALVLVVGIVLCLADFYNIVVNLLAVIAGVMVLMRRSHGQANGDAELDDQ
ncbi:MAG: hypothetical protein ABF868_02225 [Sporolactobacillus sp.]